MHELLVHDGEGPTVEIDDRDLIAVVLDELKHGLEGKSTNLTLGLTAFLSWASFAFLTLTAMTRPPDSCSRWVRGRWVYTLR